MENKKKKQFSLSLLMRIFLGLLVVVSIGVFARSVMQYNEMHREAEALKKSLVELQEARDELEEQMGSAEEVNRLLSNYEEYRKIIEEGSLEGEMLKEYTDRLADIRTRLSRSENRKYIERVAKDELNLYYADEEIFYNDINK